MIIYISDEEVTQITLSDEEYIEAELRGLTVKDLVDLNE